MLAHYPQINHMLLYDVTCSIVDVTPEKLELELPIIALFLGYQRCWTKPCCWDDSLFVGT